MTWPFEAPRTPMEARVRTTLPDPPGWAYEPKWDGFRALAWGGPEPRLDSRKQRPLLRYFPELAPALERLPGGAVVDGEIVLVVDGQTSFDALQQRIHPADSRIRLLAEQTPAELVAFDLLAVDGEDLRERPFAERRERLSALVAALGEPAEGPARWHLTLSTTDVEEGRRWFDEFESSGCDGIVAKALDGVYQEGKRAMVKVKHRRDADVVVGGYRVHKEGDRIGSLLLGLYDRGDLHFIGHCSGFGDTDRVALLERLRPLTVTAEDAALGGGGAVRAPGAESRWSAGKDLSWVPVRPELVCQISYDQLTGDRFRHATRFERWRPDKDPTDCTLEQLERPEGPTFADVVAT
ncbi:MAG: ATP-dependent DNA ligase [Egibacteraceae bacterium]